MTDTPPPGHDTHDPHDGVVIVTRHNFHGDRDYSDFSDANPTTGQPHVPLVADVYRPRDDVRLFFIKDNGDGWVYVYWITSALTYPTPEVDYGSTEEETR